MKKWIIVSVMLFAGVAFVAVTVYMGTMRTSDGATSETSSESVLRVRDVANNLTHPWGIALLPEGQIVFTERDGRISVIKGDSTTMLIDVEDVSARGEGGLLGIAVDPEFSQNRNLYACYNRSSDIIVRKFVMNESLSRLKPDAIIIDTIPSASSGRHSGCQLGFGPDGNLWVGTGDAADERTPQDRESLGGKILRVDRNGRAAEGNPDGPDQRIYSYGHRNTQGLAFFDRQIDGSYGISAEHGPGKDDEVNQLVPGNFGWAPGSSYDESVPMTNRDTFPGAINSVWSSGNSTIAISGAAFLRGEQWGDREGWLALGVLKDKHIRLLEFSGAKRGNQEIRLFENEYGRIRAVMSGPNGTLYFSTDNGVNDKIYEVTP